MFVIKGTNCFEGLYTRAAPHVPHTPTRNRTVAHQEITDETHFCLTLVVLAVTASLLLFSSASAKPSSPFVGHWVAIDSRDFSDIRLTIAGGHFGPFNITWTESYFSFCEGGPGIFKGTGFSSEADPNTLHAHMVLMCFTVDKVHEGDITFWYSEPFDSITDGTDTWVRARDK